jgi:hypothetical protein
MMEWMTMCDAPRPQFFQAVKGSRAERRQTVACALLFDPTEPLDVASTRLTWSSLMGGRLREIARAAAETGKPGRQVAPLRLAARRDSGPGARRCDVVARPRPPLGA